MTQPVEPEKPSTPPNDEQFSTQAEHVGRDRDETATRERQTVRPARLPFSMALALFGVLVFVIGLIVGSSAYDGSSFMIGALIAGFLWVAALIVRPIEKIYELLHDQAHGLL